MSARPRPFGHRARHKANDPRRAASSLQAFLEHSARPLGTLTYHELQGFLFAVVSAPELVRPVEWLPLIFNEEEAGYATIEEANAVLEQIMALYNSLNVAILEDRVMLPGDCRVLPRALDNLDDSAPLARWSRGFLMGHDWLEALWDVELPADLDEAVGAALMTLSFFSSRSLAEAFHQEAAGTSASFRAFAESILDFLPDALAQYARIGRSVLAYGDDTAPPPPKHVSRAGRNDPCPCGSGKKFKKCCGETSH